jgi:glycosyltransferase involved in cell wall biosynthesis
MIKMITKRIAIVIDSLTGGGAEKVMLSLAQELITQGHQPHLIVLQNECAYELPQNLPVHYCFEANNRNFDSFWNIKQSITTLKALIKSVEKQFGQFDMFLSNLDKSNLMTTKSGISPLFCVVHNSIEEELKRQIKLGPLAYLKMLKQKKSLNGQHLVTVSNGIESEIISKGRIQPASICTIYNPFDLNDIKQKANEIDPDIPQEPYIIHIGRVAKQKRHDVLFEALSLLKTDIKLVLLCNNKKKALKIAAKFNVQDKLIIPGFKKNPFPWIKQAKLLVLSSDYEGLPTVLIESLACNTAVVSTDCDHGPKEIMTEELAQFLVPRRNPVELAAKIDLALSSSLTLTQPKILSKVAANTVAKAYVELV